MMTKVWTCGYDGTFELVLLKVLEILNARVVAASHSIAYITCKYSQAWTQTLMPAHGRHHICKHVSHEWLLCKRCSKRAALHGVMQRLVKAAPHQPCTPHKTVQPKSKERDAHKERETDRVRSHCKQQQWHTV